MRQYLDLLSEILDHGVEKDNRTGVRTRGIFGHQFTIDLSKGFPLLTTKRMPVRAVIYDMLWMLSGDTNIKYLNEHGVHIWDPWADQDGDVGPVYGRQWRYWPDGRGGTIDQIERVVSEIRNSPNSRRLIVTAWNVADVDRMSVPPCPTLFQLDVTDGHLSCHLYQRSADAFVGLPFNIAGFSLLTAMIAQACELAPGRLIHSFGDVHLYSPHIDLAKEQLLREPYPLPKLCLNPSVKNVIDFKFEDARVEGYHSHAPIRADVIV